MTWSAGKPVKIELVTIIKMRNDHCRNKSCSGTLGDIRFSLPKPAISDSAPAVLVTFFFHVKSCASSCVCQMHRC